MRLIQLKVVSTVFVKGKHESVDTWINVDEVFSIKAHASQADLCILLFKLGSYQTIEMPASTLAAHVMGVRPPSASEPGVESK